MRILCIVLAVLISLGPAMALELGPDPITVRTPPTVTGATPSAQAVLMGDPATFTVESNDPDVTYQWMYNGTDISDAMVSVFTIGSATPGSAGDYICRISWACGDVYSLAGKLSVDQRLLFTQQPSDAYKVVGDKLVLQAKAIGVGSVSYHWKKDGNPLSDDGHFSGTATRILSINSVVVGDAGIYVCEATDSRTPVAQTAVSNPAVVTIGLLPPTLSLTHANGAATMTAVFNTNGAPLSAVCAVALPGGTNWANVTGIGIDFINKTTMAEVLEGHPVAVTPGVDTASVTFTGAGVDWSNKPAQVVPDPLTLVGLNCYALPWFEVSTSPGTRYFVNPNVLKVTLNGVALGKASGYYLLNITN